MKLRLYFNSSFFRIALMIVTIVSLIRRSSLENETGPINVSDEAMTVFIADHQIINCYLPPKRQILRSNESWIYLCLLSFRNQESGMYCILHITSAFLYEAIMKSVKRSSSRVDLFPSFPF